MASNAQDTRASVLVMPMAAVLCETLFFGVYSALFVFSTFFMVSRCRRLPGHTIRAMLAVSMVMYTISATHWAINVTDSVKALRVGRFVRTPIRQLVAVYLPTVNYVLSDAVVVWRAWTLWNRRLWLFVPPLISLVCTLITSVVGATYYYKSSLGRSKHDRVLSHYFGWTIWTLTVGTNLWATSLIFIRTWQHRRFLRSLCVKEAITTSTEKALAFMVESGALYLCIWITYIIVTSTAAKGVLLFKQPSSKLLPPTTQGIYPTAIVVVVTMRLSTADILSRPCSETGNSTIVFSPPSPCPQSSTAEDVGSSSSDEFIVVSPPDAGSFRTLAPSPPGK
ncbi:hypothetical protein BC826DRAFT_992902 [Russula brevipes]|nr:hypothetical protein BC826DRAFT_992902 [Russula brevipes]